MSPPALRARPRPPAAVSAASSAGVRDCLMPHLDRRQVFEAEFREQQLQQLKKRGQGGGPSGDPGFAFGVSTRGDRESVKALLSHVESPDRDISGSSGSSGGSDSLRPHRRHSQGLRLPPSYVFGQGKHAGQYKGAASDGVANALTYLGGGGLASKSHPHHHIAPEDMGRVFGLRSRRDEAGTMKACLQGGYAAEGCDEGFEAGELERRRQQEQAERRLAAPAAFGGHGRTRAAKEGTAATLLAPDAVGLTAAEADDEYLVARSKEEVRRIFFVRLGEQCGLHDEGDFERVFARAAASEAGSAHYPHQAKEGPPRCSIRSFRAALDAEARMTKG